MIPAPLAKNTKAEYLIRGNDDVKKPDLRYLLWIIASDYSGDVGMKDIYGRTPTEIANYYITMSKGGSKKVLAESHIDLLEALKEASEMFIGEYPCHPTTERILEAIKKAEGEK